MTEKRVRWGLLSTARINERLIPALRETERAELVGVASRSQSKADEYARARNIPRAYGSYEAMLADPDIDAVYISLPNGFHEEWAVKTADAGKHVLCEKPLALTVDEVNSMMQAARRNNVVIQEAAMYRFDPQTAKVQELIDSGAIGQIRTIQSFFGFTLKNAGDVRLDPAIGGGSLWDLGSYQVSFSRLALKANPLEVSAWQTTIEQGVDLTFCGQMRFAVGAVSQFVCSFQSVPHWEMDFIGTTGRINLDIPWKQRGEPSNVRLYQEGTSGTSAFGDNATGLVDTFTFEGGKAYHHQVDAMAASILDGATPVVSVDESRGNIATLVALYTSARENRVVKVADV
ncbi:MAG: Gfo/Idh/MocA family oxidoreductase [Burkholderiales bacterium]|nr:Gfo/Idh/MocA family oxidoreductase [Anaerolineae bacterium]